MNAKELNIQDEVAKIHHKYGTSELANYEIGKLFDRIIESRLTIPNRIETELSEVEEEDDSQQTYDIIKERIKNFLIHKVNMMKWFNIEYNGETFDGVMVDEVVKIIKSY